MKYTDGRADGGPTDKKGRKQGLERQRAGNKDQDGKGPCLHTVSVFPRLAVPVINVVFVLMFLV